MDRTVTVGQCVEVVNAGALQQVKFTDSIVAVRVAQIIQAARPYYDAYDEDRRELLDKFAKKKEDGGYEQDASGTLLFHSPKARREFEAENAALLKASTSVVIPVLNVAEVKADGLTPAAAFPLVPFLSEPAEPAA